MIQDLDEWANVLNIDAETNVPQRRDITVEEFRDGLLKDTSFSAQQYNQLTFMLTSYANPHWSCPQLLLSTVSITSNMLEMDGQTITAGNQPELFSIYGATLPDLASAAPAGFIYVVRNQ